MRTAKRLLRGALPASLLGLAGCVLLVLLFVFTAADILLQVGCEQCFGDALSSMVVANGVEGREIERPSPESPPIETVDQEPEDPDFLAFVSQLCDFLFDVFALVDGGDPGPSQSIGQIRSGGIAVAPLTGAAERLGGPSGPRMLYLTNSVDDTVLAIDTESRSLVGAAAVGRRPRGIAVTPDGARLFVANEDSGDVSVVETLELSESMRIRLPDGAEPYDVAITPDGAEAWVSGHEASGSVHILDTASLSVVESVRVGRRPVQVALSPDGTLAYLTNEEDNRLSIVDVWTRTVLRSLTVPSPHGVAFDPVGSRVYVTSHSSPGTVRMIDVGTDTVLAIWDVGEKPEYLALDALATRLFVTNRLSNFLSVINLLDGQVEREIEVPKGLGPLASAPL